MKKYEWKNLPEKELRKYLSQLSAIANKRLTRLESAGEENSPAYIKAENYTVDIKGRLAPRFRSTSKESLTDIKIELKQVIHYLNMETSTVTGMRNVLDRSLKGFNRKYNPHNELNISAADIYRVFETKEWEEFRRISDKQSVSDIVNQMVEYMTHPGDTYRDIIEFMRDALQKPNADAYLTEKLTDGITENYWNEGESIWDILE